MNSETGKYNILLSADELILIGKALSELPYKEVAMLLGNLQNQINAYNAPAGEVPVAQPGEQPT